MNVHYNVICDVIIRKTLSLIKFLRLQGDDMSAPYDKKFYLDYIEHCEQTVYRVYSLQFDWIGSSWTAVQYVMCVRFCG